MCDDLPVPGPKSVAELSQPGLASSCILLVGRSLQSRQVRNVEQ